MSENQPNDKTMIQSVNREIYRRFPAVDGVKPKVQKRPKLPNKDAKLAPAFLLIYESTVKLPANKRLPMWIRAYVDERGKILKVTTSR